MNAERGGIKGVNARNLLGSRIGPHPQTIEIVQQIRERLRAAQDRQKSYADVRRRPLIFNIGDHMFLKVSPLKGNLRFRKKGKLNPRYIGPFEILQKVGPVAYRLALPPALQGIRVSVVKIHTGPSARNFF